MSELANLAAYLELTSSKEVTFQKNPHLRYKMTAGEFLENNEWPDESFVSAEDKAKIIETNVVYIVIFFDLEEDGEMDLESANLIAASSIELLTTRLGKLLMGQGKIV